MMGRLTGMDKANIYEGVKYLSAQLPHKRFLVGAGCAGSNVIMHAQNMVFEEIESETGQRVLPYLAFSCEDDDFVRKFSDDIWLELQPWSRPWLQSEPQSQPQSPPRLSAYPDSVVVGCMSELKQPQVKNLRSGNFEALPRIHYFSCGYECDNLGAKTRGRGHKNQILGAQLGKPTVTDSHSHSRKPQ